VPRREKENKLWLHAFTSGFGQADLEHAFGVAGGVGRYQLIVAVEPDMELKGG
jgi:hypothetical protein